MKALLGILLRPTVITVLALLLTTLVIWFGGQLLREKRIWSLSDFALVLLIALIWAVAGGLWFYRRMQARKRAQLIEDRLRTAAKEQIATVRPDRQPEIEALEKQFEEALEALRSSKLGKQALYALPWYIIVGPPGSGKTTMLKESNLNFPHMATGGRGIRGVGGTRNCDWWFTDEGILLDTAGRYTTESEDHEEWLSFLDMLRKARKHEPINGAIVAISIEDVLGGSDEELADHCEKIRTRLAELGKELDMVFPIYLVLTKCDLLDGFVESFGSMARAERGQVWGCTMTKELRQGRAVAEVFEEQFDALYDQLGANRLGLMAADRSASKQGKVYSFPLQFHAARERLIEFVGQLVQPNPYFEGAELRGFYFTSGTQEGTPIDRVLSAMGQAFGLDEKPDAASHEDKVAKSYFIDQLFTDVVFPDRTLSHRSTRLERRQSVLRQLGLYGSAAAGVILLVSLFISFFGNRSQIAQADDLVSRVSASLSLRVRLVEGGEALPAITAEQQGLLDELRASFIQLDADFYSLDSFLLGRSDDLHGIVRPLYIEALKAYYLVPTQRYLSKVLTEGLDQKLSDYFEYRSFDAKVKAYSMLGGRKLINPAQLAHALETEHLWNQRSDMIGVAPKVGMKPLSEDAHFRAFIDRVILGDTNWCVAPDPQILDRAREYLSINNKAAKAVESALEDPNAEVVDAAGILGVDKTKFELPEAVPEILTRSLSEAEQEIAKRLAGIGGEEVDAETSENAKRLFREDYLERWKSQLASLVPAASAFSDLNRAQTSLRDYTGPDSGYRAALRTVSDRLYQAGALTRPSAEAVGSDVDQQWLDSALKRIAQLEDALAKFTAYPLHDRILRDLAENEGKAIAALLEAITDTHDAVSKTLHSAEIELQPAARKAMNGLIGAVEEAFREEARYEAREYWKSEIGQELRSFGPRFPFTADASEDVPMDAFIGMFHADGSFDTAMQVLDRLTRLRVARKAFMSFSLEFVRDVQRVRRLQAAMFPEDAKTPAVPFRVRLDREGHVSKVQLFISGTKEINTKMSRAAWQGAKEFAWGSDDAGAKIRVSVSTKPQATVLGIDAHDAWASSRWSFFRLIQTGSPQPLGDDSRGISCGWTFVLKRSGSEDQVEVANLELITVAEQNPFRRGFFAGYEFPKSVFQ